ncbi:MAG: class I SAM-dependent methyltransferase [Dehalococcoidia bacterium]|nr:class I SAM-dependent methyltransferase [Dehalococcoidia bacterium]
MPDDAWVWDETLFGGSARFYARGRLPYAAGLADAFARALALDGRGRLLDVGCGPGTVALQLVHLFEEVVGVDPDAAMLDGATRAAGERGVANARWRRLRAEDLPDDLGAFRVVTFAKSFHWMDRERVVAAVREMLAPGGAFVLVSDRNAVVAGGRAEPDDATPPLPYPAPPIDAIDRVVKRYLGRERRAGQSVRNTSPGDEEAVLARAGFEPPEAVWVSGGQVLTRDAEDVMALVYSRSFRAPHLFGDRLDAFDRDLRAVLRAAAPDGRFAERVPDTELRIWRREASSARTAG